MPFNAFRIKSNVFLVTNSNSSNIAIRLFTNIHMNLHEKILFWCRSDANLVISKFRWHRIAITPYGFLSSTKCDWYSLFMHVNALCSPVSKLITCKMKTTVIKQIHLTPFFDHKFKLIFRPIRMLHHNCGQIKMLSV